MERISQTRIVLLIQFFHSFASGFIGVVVPLMMKERNIDIAVIGLVFAAMPLIMQLGRIIFATLSDFWGRKPFFFSNGALGFISSIIYYLASTPLEFLFGKVAEGTKEGALWAVNRAFLLERSRGRWRILVHLRSTVYVSYAFGSLMAGFLVVLFLFEGTMLICAILGLSTIFLSLFIVSERKAQFSMDKALRFLDFRKKTKIFKIFLVLFFVIGLSYGFRSGFIIPLFLDKNGFSAEAIGLIIGTQILLAGFSSLLFSKSTKIRQFILWNGILTTITFSLLGFLGSVYAASLGIIFGFIEGMSPIGQEGILSKICDKESYGTDIGLLMMGLHIGETLSLALSGFLIARWGFTFPFLLAASTYIIYYLTSYHILKD